MANLEHLRLFFENKQWDEWRQKSPNTVPDLRGADLSVRETKIRALQGINGSRSFWDYMNLTLAHFDDAILVGASLSYAYLMQASFVRADMRHVDLSLGLCSGANLSEANLQGAFLVRATMNDAKLFSADLRKATLRKTILESSDLREANLVGVHASECILYDANVAGADLTGADLRWASLSRVNLLETRSGRDLRHLKLRGATLFQTNLRGAVMSEMDLRKSDFRQTDLRGADLRGADLTQSFFKETMVADTLFDGAQLDWDQVTRSNDRLTSKHRPYWDAWQNWDNEEEWDEE